MKGQVKLKANESGELGKKFVHTFDGLDILVEIKAVRKLFGRKEWEVQPAGQVKSGTVWIYAQEKTKFL